MTNFLLVLLWMGTIPDAGPGAPSEPVGIVQGVVVDGSQQGKPLEHIKVLLRAGADGPLIPVAETETDRYGRFVFEQVPTDPEIVYLPGANRGGVHYPGRRVRLNADNRVVRQKIVAFDAVASPSPLVAKRHDLDITVESQALKITETILISNPTQTTYVGKSTGPDRPPVTFWLSIPEDFDRVTFDKEFFGRRFLVVDHRPVTDIPWTPGEKEMRFTYHVPLAESEGRFRRSLDVPTSRIHVRVHGAGAKQVTCNLPPAQAAQGEVDFASDGERLTEPFALDLEFGALPIPWMQYARWGALGMLIALVATTVVVYRLRRRRGESLPEPKKRPQSSSRRRAA